MTNNEAVDSFEDIAVEACLLLDIRAAADKIEHICGDLLAEPPAGIYQIGRLDPILTPGTPCYWMDGQMRRPVERFEDVVGSVYDESGRVLIAARLMKERSKFLSNTSWMPYRGIYIAKELVDYEINRNVGYRRGGRTLGDMIGKHFSKDSLVEVDLDQLNQVESCFRRERTELSDFLGDNSWNMFFTRLQSSTVRVEKCMDWRAWEWEQKHGATFRAGKYA